MQEKATKREDRVHVMLTKDEREIISAAAKRAGVGVSTYLRLKALEAARDGRP